MENIAGEGGRGQGNRVTTQELPARSTSPVDQAPAAASPRPHRTSMDHCEFLESPLHGYGVFATEDIQPGTEIIRERALWVVDTATALNCTCSNAGDYSDARRNMIASFNASCPDADPETRELLKQDILGLHGGFTPGQTLDGSPEEVARVLSKRLREVMLVNGQSGTAEKKPTYLAVFRAASRLNHSCAPNAASTIFKTAPDTTYHIAYITKRVKKGEEVFIDYLKPPIRTFDKRQTALQSRWKFTCTCRLCAVSKEEIKASDDRREKFDAATKKMEQAYHDRAQPMPVWKKETIHIHHLQQCDKDTVEAMGVLDKFAEKEGLTDLYLFRSLTHAADAAERLKKFSLASRLVDRLDIVCRTHNMGERTISAVGQRRERLARNTAAIALMAERLSLK